MILVADSGSTKCDWILAKGKEVLLKTSSMGFNPFFHDENFVFDKLSENADLKANANEVSEIFYYGAGASSPDLKDRVKQPMQRFFPNASVNVDHDLSGAAFATCTEDEQAIACILGTGSNSCLYDNGKIYEHVPALGYILGDEGSGSYFGKKLLTLYLYNKLPKNIEEDFREIYGLDKDSVFQNVYMKPHANVYLASFMRFLSDRKKDDWVKNFIYKGFSEFISIHIWKYPNYKNIPIHFVGSIAYYFEDLLREEGKIHYLNIGKIIKQPVYELVRYHTQAEFSDLS